MKSHRFVLSVVRMSLATVTFAQSDAHKMAELKRVGGSANSVATATQDYQYF